MPPEQQTQITPEGDIQRESFDSRRGSLFSRRESLGSRRGSLFASVIEGAPEEGKIVEDGSTLEGQVGENEMQTVPEQQPEAEPEPAPEPEPEPEPLSPEEEKRLREEEEQIRKKIAIEMRKAELRAKMEEASMARRAKKGFMTPERKKKLRLLLRKKAAEELRKEQERKANERRWIIEERCGDPEDLEWASKDDLIDICEDYFQRIIEIESDKWDIEYELRKQTFEITELTQKVSDLRGKFQRPILKKVSKYENKFAKLQRKAAEYNFRSQLKIVRRPDYKPKEEDKKGHDDKVLEENENTAKEEETEGTNENETEVAERTSLHDEEDLNKPRLEDSDIVDAVVEVEDYIKKIYTGTDGSRLEEEVRLEGDSAPVEGAVPEGVEGGQSPDQGEVQPLESPEGSEPPPPPQPQHSPDDLWDYLKETVTGEHPATVEEFVQKLIGTLEHVPEEYLKPVIDYNIKRATSPSVTDGENLETKEGDQNTQVEGQTDEILGSEVHPQENGDLLVKGEDHVIDGETLPAEGEGVAPERSSSIHDDTGFPQEPSESAEGFTALQAES